MNWLNLAEFRLAKPPCDTDNIDQNKRALEHEEARISLYDCNRRPQQRRNQKQYKAITDNADIKSDEDRAGYACEGANPFYGEPHWRSVTAHQKYSIGQIWF
jgi:hypothetical protein